MPYDQQVTCEICGHEHSYVRGAWAVAWSKDGEVGVTYCTRRGCRAKAYETAEADAQAYAAALTDEEPRRTTDTEAMAALRKLRLCGPKRG